MTTFTEYATRARAALSALMLRNDEREPVVAQRSNLASLGRVLRRRKTDREMDETAAGILDMATAFERATEGWLSDEDIRRGRTGTFDSCDLLCWIELARMAGVPAVPARIIATLTGSEVDTVSGAISAELLSSLKTGGALRRLRDAMDRLAKPGRAEATNRSATTTREEIMERLANAMDDVQDHEMVRYRRCGGSDLKAVAGAGLAGPEAPTTQFSKDLETGPGWLRRGNRRTIRIDQRILNAMVRVPDNYAHHFVARPWVAASHWVVADDVHRAGTRLEGPGAWPAEWRAFVEDGVVVGVSAYYAWAHKGTAEDARAALTVRDLAQRIVDETKKRKVRPMNFDAEVAVRLADQSTWPGRENPEIERLDRWTARCPATGTNCCLDFIEAEGVIALLEGGPGVVPMGMNAQGCHPIGFAAGMEPGRFAVADVTGVVLAAPGFNASEHETWKHLDRSSIVRSWRETEILAETAVENTA